MKLSSLLPWNWFGAPQGALRSHAQLGRLASENSDYTGPVDAEQHPDVDIVPDSWKQRRRCTLAYMNSPLVKGIVDSQVRQIAGSITIESDTGSSRADDIIKDEWKRFLDNGGLVSIQQIIRHVLTDGGAVPRVISAASETLDVETLPYRRIYTPFGQPNLDPTHIRDGFKYDARGKKQIACYIRNEESMYDVVYWNGEYTEVPVVTHPRLPVLAGQTKGLSWYSSAIVRLEMIQRWQEALLNSTELQAYLIALCQSPGPDATQLARGMSGATANAGQLDSKTEKGVRDYARKHRFLFLPKGGDFKIIQAKAPEVADFLIWNLRFVARALGTSYERLVYDLTKTSFSSTKFGDRDDRVTVGEQQSICINDVLRPLNSHLIQSLMLRPKVVLPGSGRYATDAEGYERCVTFQLPGRPPVDELKTENANTAALRNRSVSRTRICADKGDDHREILNELMREDAAYLKSRILMYQDCGWEEEEAREYALEDMRATAVFKDSALDAQQDDSGDPAAKEDPVPVPVKKPKAKAA